MVSPRDLARMKSDWEHDIRGRLMKQAVPGTPLFRAIQYLDTMLGEEVVNAIHGYHANSAPSLEGMRPGESE